MRRAFTLIELLVIIAIIAILAAILFPVFSQAKRAAKDTVTISNMKQLGTGFALYEGDYDDTIPPAIHSLGGEGVVGGWVFLRKLYDAPSKFEVTKGVMFPYVKSAEVYVSPLDAFGKVSGLSFSFNSCLSVWPVGTGVVPSMPATWPESPSTQMLLGEEAEGKYGTDDGYFYPSNPFTDWHRGGNVILFVDSHAKMVRAKDRYNELLYGDAAKTACR